MTTKPAPAPTAARRPTAAFPQQGGEVDVAWSSQFVERKGYTEGNLVVPVTSIFDRFLQQQERNFELSNQKKVETHERLLMSEWKATRKVQIEPKRGCWKDSKWYWLLLKSYVLQRDFITGYIPRRVTHKSRKFHEAIKKKGYPTSIPAATPLPTDATLEESYEDIVSYRQELDEYLRTEWEPPALRVDVATASREFMSHRRRTTLLRTNVDHFQALNSSSIDAVHQSLHGHSPIRKTRGGKKTDESIAAPSDFPHLVSPGKVRPHTSMGIGSRPQTSSPDQKMKKKKPAHARISADLQNEIQFISSMLDDDFVVDEESRENLHGSEKISRRNMYGMRIREGLYVQKPIKPLNAHSAMKWKVEEEERQREARGEVEEEETNNARLRNPLAHAIESDDEVSPDARHGEDDESTFRRYEYIKKPHVLDYGFCHLKNLADLLTTEPRDASRGTMVKEVKEDATAAKALEEEQESQRPKKGPAKPPITAFSMQDLNTVSAFGENYAFHAEGSFISRKGAFQDLVEDANDLASRYAGSFPENMEELEQFREREQQRLDSKNPEKDASWAIFYANPYLGQLLRNEGPEREKLPPRSQFCCEILRLNDNMLSESSVVLNHETGLDLAAAAPLLLSMRISGLHNIVHLDLSVNRLALFPSWIHEMPLLHTLHLHANKIKTFESVFEVVGLRPEQIALPEADISNFVGAVTTIPKSRRRKPVNTISILAKPKIGGRKTYNEGTRSEHEIKYKSANMTNIQMYLRTLTLHGNPLEKTVRETYKRNVLAAFPYLSKLDFADLTDDERNDCFTLSQQKQLGTIMKKFDPSKPKPPDPRRYSVAPDELQKRRKTVAPVLAGK